MLNVAGGGLVGWLLIGEYGKCCACQLSGILFSLLKENMPIIAVNRFRLLFKSHNDVSAAPG